MRLTLARLHPDAVLPTRATSGSIGYDLSIIGEHTITYGEFVRLPTGWALGAPLPPDLELTIRPRSSLAKHGLFIPNSPGTIDQDYTGEIQVQVARWVEGRTTLAHGTRVAQLIFSPVKFANLYEVPQEFQAFEVVREGFGSTGL